MVVVPAWLRRHWILAVTVRHRNPPLLSLQLAERPFWAPSPGVFLMLGGADRPFDEQDRGESPSL